MDMFGLKAAILEFPCRLVWFEFTELSYKSYRTSQTLDLALQLTFYLVYEPIDSQFIGHHLGFSNSGYILWQNSIGISLEWSLLRM